MGRVQENKELIVNTVNLLEKDRTEVAVNSAILAILSDISVSLAVIADKEVADDE